MAEHDEELKGCPFCGTKMHPHEHCFSHPKPFVGDCILRHYSFDNNKAADWNTRAALTTKDSDHGGRVN